MQIYEKANKFLSSSDYSKLSSLLKYQPSSPIACDSLNEKPGPTPSSQ